LILKICGGGDSPEKWHNHQQEYCSVVRRVPQLASVTLKICRGGDSPEN